MRHPRVIDEQGEILDECPECSGKDHELRELQRKMKGMARELGELRADKNREALEHKAWPYLVRLFQFWQQQCNHPRARWSSARFWSALHLFDTWGPANFAAAIAGIAFQPNSRQLKNGKWEIYDSWELLTRDSGTFERYIKRRPRNWQCPQQFLEAKHEQDSRTEAPAERGDGPRQGTLGAQLQRGA